MTKRVYVPQAKPGELIARWGRPGPREKPDLVYAWGADGACKSDGRILSEALERIDVMEGRGLRAELEARGYDITTLRFSIQKKQTT
jgi:hypothetical protein